MTLVQLFTVGFIVLNSISFIIAAKVLFRSDEAQTPAYLFMVSFLILLGTTLWFLYHYPTPDIKKNAAAVFLSVLSLGLFAWASAAIRHRPFTVIFSPDAPQFLNQSGPYRILRHPFYTSYLLNFTAAAIASSHWCPKATLAAIFYIYYVGASSEEKKFSTSSFREEYNAYKARTGMFFPRLKVGPLS